MGMSASQARLLTITSRLSDLELEAQRISNNKIRLATKSESIATAYTAALNNKKLIVSVGSGAGATSIDLSANTLTGFNKISATEPQRILKNSSGKLLINDTMAAAFKGAKDCTLGNLSFTYDNYKNMDLSTLKNEARFVEFVSDAEGRPELDGTPGYGFNDYLKLCENIGESKLKYYQNIFLEGLKSGYEQMPQGVQNDTSWLYDQLEAGNITMEKWSATGGDNAKGGFVSTSLEGDTTIKEVYDTSDDDAAQATYDAEMSRINSQDKQYDLKLKQVETEHTAMQTEYDSVKKVIDKNIERNFKMFS